MEQSLLLSMRMSRRQAHVLLIVVSIWVSLAPAHSLSAKGIGDCKKVFAALVIGAACGLGGCATPDKIWKDGALSSRHEIIRKELARQFETNLADRAYEWIITIEFAEYDFGNSADHYQREAFKDPHSRAIISRRKLPIKGIADGRGISVSKYDAPQSWGIPQNSKGLLDLRFRHNGSGRALRVLDQVLENPKETLSKSLVMVSAGSWGANEVGSFASGLRSRYGKDVDVVVVSDAIVRPVPVSMIWISGLSDSTVKVNSYQRNGILAGLPLWGFFNLKWDEKEADHVSAASDASDHLRSIVPRIFLTSEGPKIRLAVSLYGESAEARFALERNPALEEKFFSSDDWVLRYAAAYATQNNQILEAALNDSDYRIRFGAYLNIMGQPISAETEALRHSTIEGILDGKFGARSRLEALKLFRSTSEYTPNFSLSKLSDREWEFLLTTFLETSKDSSEIEKWVVDTRQTSFFRGSFPAFFISDPFEALKRLADFYEHHPEGKLLDHFELGSILRGSTTICLEFGIGEKSEVKARFLKLFHLLYPDGVGVGWSYSYSLVIEVARKLGISNEELNLLKSE